MLQKLLASGYGTAEDFNCAEKILYGANQVYHLGLDEKALRLSAGFGGGMGIEHMCGALSAAVMVLSVLFVKKNAHESTRIKTLSKEMFDSYETQMGELLCKPLKEKYRNEEIGCRNVILKAAEVLDGIVQREGLFTNSSQF